MSEKNIPDKYGGQFGADFEFHILAVLTRVSEALARYRTAFKHTFFSTDLMRTVARALLSHYDKYQTLPKRATLLEDVRQLVEDNTYEKVEKLVRKLYKHDTSDYKAVLDKAIDFAKTQAIKQAVLQGVDKIQEGKLQEVRRLVEEAERVGDDIGHENEEYVETIEQRIERYLEGDEDRASTAIPTGMYHLDHILEGGLCRGELATILAPPKFGKSTSLINIGAGGLTSGEYNILHITCEMGKRETERRYDDWFARDGVRLKKQDKKRFTTILRNRTIGQAKGKLWILEYPQRRLSPSMVRSKVNSMHASGCKPDCIIVDYGDLLVSDTRSNSDWMELKYIYDELGGIAKEFDCAVWTASQIQRNAVNSVKSKERDTYEMQDVAASWEKVASADLILSLNQTQDERSRGTCRIYNAGARNVGDGQTIACEINRKQALLKSKAVFLATGEHLDLGEDKMEVQKFEESKQRSKKKKKSARKQIRG